MATEPGSTSVSRKFDQGKSRMDLLSPIWIEGVGYVLAFGAWKYSADEWRQGLPVRKLLGAALRHIFAAFWTDIDKDSGYHHLLCASCELMFAYETLMLRKNFDDRWRPEATGLPGPEVQGVSVSGSGGSATDGGVQVPTHPALNQAWASVLQREALAPSSEKGHLQRENAESDPAKS